MLPTTPPPPQKMTTATISTAAISGENAITTTGIIAVLPPCLLWAASMAASSDENKAVLCSIDVRRMGDGKIAIASTDGHRLFRVIFNESERFYIDKGQTEPFRLNPKAFAKATGKKMATCWIDSSGVAQFHDALGRVTDACAWQAETHANAIGQEYPKYMQLWPSDNNLTCAPGDFIAFNARYIGDFCKIVEKMTTNNVVRFYTTNSAVQPCVMRAELDLELMLCENKGSKLYKRYEEDSVWLEYLIMPVQVRK